MGRPVPRQFLRNAVLDLITIVPATAYHHRSYAERYSRFSANSVIYHLGNAISFNGAGAINFFNNTRYPAGARRAAGS